MDRTSAELQWWSKTIKENNPHSIMKDLPPQVVITTDPAPETWGATLQIVKNDKFLNLKKLTVIHLTLEHFLPPGRLEAQLLMNILNMKQTVSEEH
jgi:hypothetical protein